MAPADAGHPAAYPPLLFSLDVEDHREQYPAREGRYQELTLAVLDFLDAQHIRGTAFVVGRVALSAPWLVREVAARGHEIACHGLEHRALTRQTPQAFLRDTREAKTVLEQTCGQAVTGYRAPVFSLTRHTAWAVRLLAELGFAYSSSVMPVAHPLHGFPGAPAAPFRWAGSLPEFPCPVARLGPLTVPFLGGIYLRYLPGWLIRRLLARVAAPAWTYLHPYDFDGAEGYVRFPERSRLSSLLLSGRRGHTYGKLRDLYALRPAAANASQPRTFDAWARHEPLLAALQPFAVPAP